MKEMMSLQGVKIFVVDYLKGNTYRIVNDVIIEVSKEIYEEIKLQKTNQK